MLNFNTINIDISIHKSLILTFVIFCFISLFQIKQANAQRCDYYLEIHSAEEKLIKKDFLGASKVYKQIFSEYQDIYLKDLNNALIAAHYSNDKEVMDFLVGLFTQWSIDTSFIDGIGGSDKQPFPRQLIDTLKRLTNHNETTSLCTMTSKLNILDQSLRNSCKELSPQNPYKYCGSEIMLLDSLILNDLMKFINKSGFPHLRDFCSRSSLGHPFHIIFLHNLMWGRTEFIETLHKQVYEMKFHPQQYANLIDYIENNLKEEPNNQQSNNFGNAYHLLNTKTNRLYVLPIEDKSLLDNINENRSRICLEDFDDMNRKIIFQYKHPEFKLIFPSNFSTIHMDSSTFDSIFKKWDKYVVD